MNDLKYGYYDGDDNYYDENQDVTYSEAGYEDYYDYGDETGGDYTEGPGYEEYYEEESDNSVQEDPAPVTAEDDLSGETTAAPEESEKPDSNVEEAEQDNERGTEQTSPAEPSTTVTSYYEEEQSRDYENYDGEEDYQAPDVGEKTEDADADTDENRDRDNYDEDPNYTEGEDKYEEVEEPYEESNAEQEQEAESEYEDEDMDTLYKNYEILSDFYQKHYVDLRVLDETCEPTKYPAPVIANGIVRRYERVDNVLLPGKQYRQAVYGCNSGYELSERTSDSMFCQEYAWTGLEPECERSENWQETTEGPQAQACDEGFELSREGECEDIDECLEDNGGCDEDCINKPGSFMCECPRGWELGQDGQECVDSDECRGNNGHGPCQDSCVNTQGSYYCTCDNIEGSQLASDDHTCEILDMCAGNPEKCSHGCYSAQGRAYCTCPEGLQLGEDWRTCHDIDECGLGSVCDQGQCVNTPGSFTCVTQECGPGEEERAGECLPADPECGEGERLSDGQCRPICGQDTCSGRGECHVSGDTFWCDCDEGHTGHRCECGPGYRHDGERCADIDECYEDRPCSQVCTNTQGSYTCSCDPGYSLVPGGGGQCQDLDECSAQPGPCDQGCVNSAGGYQCICHAGYSAHPEDPSRCEAQGCPPLQAPEAGILNCSPGAIVPGTVCRLECQQGTVRFGKQRRKCLDNGTWEEGIGWCKRITCPPLSLSGQVRVLPEECLSEEQTFKSKCRLSCPKDFKFEGSRAAFCGKANKWIFRNGPTRCVPPAPVSSPPSYSQIPAPAKPPVKTTPIPQKPAKVSSPYIVCPPDIRLNLTGQPPMMVNIPRPKTNMDWEANVVTFPPRAKSLSFYQEPGDIEVKFEASDPVSKQTAICTVRVHVKDVTKPSVSYCPQSRSVFLEPGQASQKVHWSEPSFQDNVKIEHVIASALPGQELALGKHVIVYQATDKEGNREKCVFSITVVQFEQEDTGRRWVLCRVGNTGRQIRLLVTKVPAGCRLINIAQPPK